MAENKNQEVHYRAIQPNEWIENVFTEAIMRGASDIHIEPSRQELKVRLRIDGNLQEIESSFLPLSYLNAVIPV